MREYGRRIPTHIFGAGAGDVDPGLGEDRAGPEHEDDVEDRMDRVLHHVLQGLRGGQVVAQTPHGVRPRRAPTPNVLQRKVEPYSALNILSERLCRLGQ